MDRKYFPLGNIEESRIVKIFQIIFGAACIGMAIWWINFSLKSVKTDWSMWASIIFLIGFGFYMIWTGLGKAVRYVIIDEDVITVKKNALLSPVNIKAGKLSRIEIFPLSVMFFKTTGKKYMLRFGSVNYETNEKIIDEIIRFGEENNIPYEVKEDEI